MEAVDFGIRRGSQKIKRRPVQLEANYSIATSNAILHVSHETGNLIPSLPA
jgi:hypothetical protein